jgi:Cof subfamily protein (haloacid dehalogenase superfamily)
MYKMIAVDMDGTLLKHDKTISDETLRAIKLARSKGVKLVLATGRPIEGIEKYLEELDLINIDDYAISYNGVIVQNTLTKEIISRKTIAIEDLDYLFQLSKNIGVNFHAFTNEGLIAPNMSKYTIHECEINNLQAKIVDFNTLDKNTEVFKFMMIGEEDELDEATKNLPKEVFEKYTVVRSAFCFLEFINKECNKGESIKTLANHLAIDISDVICIGDAGNDLHMIKYAGLGVAMGNAYPEVKEVADYITKTNEDDGVAHVIHKFILAS